MNIVSNPRYRLKYKLKGYLSKTESNFDSFPFYSNAYQYCSLTFQITKIEEFKKPYKKIIKSLAG